MFRPPLMILGEFEYLTMMESIRDDRVAMTISSFFIIAIAMVGSFVLVNLILGKEMQRDSPKFLFY